MIHVHTVGALSRAAATSSKAALSVKGSVSARILPVDSCTRVVPELHSHVLVMEASWKHQCGSMTHSNRRLEVPLDGCTATVCAALAPRSVFCVCACVPLLPLANCDAVVPLVKLRNCG